MLLLITTLIIFDDTVNVKVGSDKSSVNISTLEGYREFDCLC